MIPTARKSVNPYPDISVVIVNYRTPEWTRKAVASVLNHCSTVSTEIFVVDNGSGDGSAEAMRSCWGGRVIVIENKRNVGFAVANNQAMRQAQGRFYLLLNSDAELVGEALERMLTYAESHPNVGIMGCNVVGSDGRQQASCWRPYGLAYLISRAFNLYRLLPDGWFGTTNIEEYGKPATTCAVDVVSGCVMLVRADAAKKVGLFDERYFMYCEDMDWCTQMRASGYEVHYFAEATVRHYGGGTSAEMHTPMSVEQSRSTMKYLLKQRGWATACLGNLLMLLFFAFRLPLWHLYWLIKSQRKKASVKIKSYWSCLFWHLGWPFITR